MSEPLLTRYMQPLLAGRRSECFALVQHAVQGGWSPERVVRDVVWPAMAQVERLFRDDRINVAIEHMAVRINRTVADQVQALLPSSAANGKRLIVTCADGETEELGAQMAADLFQSRGWDVYFPGGGVPADEILALIGQLRPSILLIFGTQPSGVPGTRRLIEMIRGVGIGQTMNIIVSGGIFDRADGLWQEVGADMFAEGADEAIALAESAEPREPRPMPLGMVKKRRRRRRSAEPAPAMAF
ncbi:MAG: hypothetical protein CHACPFDD_01837 [Phycisphaerae bacterium]|nr:hypothetical protein [Phycisphaerae bacterium]